MSHYNAEATAKNMLEWADKIDNRLGPVSGSDADRAAHAFRRAATIIRALDQGRDAAVQAERDRCSNIVSHSFGTNDRGILEMLQVMLDKIAFPSSASETAPPQEGEDPASPSSPTATARLSGPTSTRPNPPSAET